jgi:small-conductance mechanosensitive channel
MDDSHKEFLLNVLSWEKILTTALAALAISWITNRLRALTDGMAKRWHDRRLGLLQIRSVVVFFVYFLGTWSVAKYVWKLSHDGLLLFSATLAVGLGFALKPIAESIVGGLVLIFDGPFQVGDRVTFKGHYGDIQMIGFRATRLLTLDKTLVTIPNHLFLKEATLSGNTGALDMMVDMDFYVALSADLPLAKKLVERAVTRTAHVNHEKPVIVLAKEIPLGPLPAYRLRAKVIVKDFAKEKLCLTDLTIKVHELFRDNFIPRPLEGVSSPMTPSSLARIAHFS